jgi:hypothetical protein
MELDPIQVHVITGVVLPVLVGLLVKSNFPSKVKVIVTFVASGFVTLLLNAVNDSGVAVLSWDLVTYWLIQTVIAVSMYLGVYREFGLNDSLPTIPLGLDGIASPGAE